MFDNPFIFRPLIAHFQKLSREVDKTTPLFLQNKGKQIQHKVDMKRIRTTLTSWHNVYSHCLLFSEVIILLFAIKNSEKKE